MRRHIIGFSCAAFIGWMGSSAVLADYDATIASMVQAIEEGSVSTPGTIVYYLNELTRTDSAWSGIRETGDAACNTNYLAFARNELDNLGYFTSVVTQSFTARDFRGVERTGCNIIAEKTGTLAPSARRVYVFLAHIDTQRDTLPSGGTVGADDNGSGAAALLTIAREFSDANLALSHTVRFVMTDGEEDGELGAEDHARSAYNAQERIGAVVNVDMAGHYYTSGGNPTLVKVYENCKSMWLTDLAELTTSTYSTEINSSYAGTLTIDRRFDGPGTGQPHPLSDQQPFWNRLYDGIWFHEYDTHWEVYHTPSDTIANMKPDYATKVARLAAATLAELADHGKHGRDVQSIVGGTVTINGTAYPLSGTVHEDTAAALYGNYDLWGDVDFNGGVPPTTLWWVMPVIVRITGYYEPWFCLDLGTDGSTVIKFQGLTGTLTDTWSVDNVDRYTYHHTFSGELNGTLPGAAAPPFGINDLNLTWIPSTGNGIGRGVIQGNVGMTAAVVQIPVSYTLTHNGAAHVTGHFAVEGAMQIASIAGDGSFTGTATARWAQPLIPAVSTWGIGSLAVLTLVAGTIVLRRRCIAT